MVNAEILTKAIQKAIDGGWEQGKNLHVDDTGSPFRMYPESSLGSTHIYGHDTSIKEIIFNHDFAKALWGDWNIVETGRIYNADGSLDGAGTVTSFSGKIWQYHLQQMVIAEDPIKYLGEHLNG